MTDDDQHPRQQHQFDLERRHLRQRSGATVTGTATSRIFTLTAALAPDTFYSGSMQATDSVGAVTIQKYSFDTFRTSTCYVVESEDFNYGSGQRHRTLPAAR